MAAHGKISIVSQKAVNSGTLVNRQVRSITEGIIMSISTVARDVEFRYKKKTDKETGAETQRATEVLNIKFPVIQDLVADAVAGLASTDEKVKVEATNSLALMQSAVDSIIEAQARAVLEDTTATTFDYSKIDWSFIANLPPAERRGGGISKEVWDEFVADYKAIMPAVTGKNQEQVDNAAAIIGNRLAKIKTTPEYHDFFEQQLMLYAENSKQVQENPEFIKVLEFLTGKIAQFRQLKPEDLLGNL